LIQLLSPESHMFLPHIVTEYIYTHCKPTIPTDNDTETHTFWRHQFLSQLPASSAVDRTRQQSACVESRVPNTASHTQTIKHFNQFIEILSSNACLWGAQSRPAITRNTVEFCNENPKWRSYSIATADITRTMPPQASLSSSQTSKASICNLVHVSAQVTYRPMTICYNTTVIYSRR